MRMYAVIPSGNRQQELTALVQVLVEDDVHVVVVDTGYSPALTLGGAWSSRITILEDKAEPKNIQRWWNQGIDWIAGWENDNEEEYVVAILNDDIVIEKGFVPALAGAILFHDVAGSFPDIYGMGRDFVAHQLNHWRMSGYAFAMRGRLGFRADERLVWWGGDTDLNWRMWLNGGMVTVGGLKLHHLYPNQSTVGELAEQAGRDRETFKEIHGRYGW